jgi:hypothetical protein
MQRPDEKGMRGMLAGADKLIGKGYRYFSDHVSKKVSSSTQATLSKLNSLTTVVDTEEDEENELFAQLLVEEKQIVSDEKSIVEPDSSDQITRMMEEGVIEDPHVDHDDALETSFESQANVKENDVTVVEGLHVTPSKEELDSGEAVLIKPAAAHEFIEEQFESENEDDESESNEQEIDGSQANKALVGDFIRPGSLAPQATSSPLFLAGPFVKGPLTFKMVNTHFLALMDAFRNAGWSKLAETASASDVSLFITKPVTPVVGSSSKMISQISHSSCLGGTKGTQLSCRSKFALEYGCTFESLNVSPKQYNMWKSTDCERFFEQALLPENAEKQWIGKVGASYHGRHITIYKGVTKSIKSHYGKCKMNRDSGGGYIMMEYVSDPALLGNRKFDLRTFLLIADTNPFLVFYHRGFVRRSANKYSSDVNDKLAHVTNIEAQTSEDHFMGFDDLQKSLHQELNFAPDYLVKVFEPRVKRITNYVFQAARARLKRKIGAYQLFGLDWMIDRKGNMHLLEGNGNPVVKHYPDTNDLTPKIWRDMALLLTKVHMAVGQSPEDRIGPLKEGFKYGGWELVFSELEEIATAQPYNPCTAGL